MCVICEDSLGWTGKEVTRKQLIANISLIKAHHPKEFKIAQMGHYERKCFSHECYPLSVQHEECLTNKKK